MHDATTAIACRCAEAVSRCNLEIQFISESEARTEAGCPHPTFNIKRRIFIPTLKRGELE